MSDQPLQRKVCLLGDFGSGKTSLVRRYVEGIFSDDYISTIGVKISRRTVFTPNNRQVNLIIWDLAGGSDFDGKQASYLQGSLAAVLICDLTRKTTLTTLRKYIKIMREIEPAIQFLLLANKNDLTDLREIADEEISLLANEIQAAWFTTSAKTGEQVQQAFDQLAFRLEPP